jgi:Ca-activated chloride channel family protein
VGYRTRAIAPTVLTALIVLAALATPRAQRVPVFKSAVDIVNLPVTVSDRKGNLITTLAENDFEVYEDGKKQSIRYFSLGLGPVSPEMHLGLLIDVSNSMGPSMAFMKTAAIKFLKALPDLVDVTVVDFDAEIRAARYAQADFPRLIERIRMTRAGGTTALYDAIGVYLDGASSQDGRKIMLLYTDGADTVSSLGFNELLDLLKASDVTIYCIGRIERINQSTINQMSLLSRIAEVTGGHAFFPTTNSDLELAYERVLKEVRAQYAIGYVSTNEKTDGAWRKVEIKIVAKDARDLRIRARNGYYAPYKNNSGG